LGNTLSGQKFLQDKINKEIDLRTLIPTWNIFWIVFDLLERFATCKADKSKEKINRQKLKKVCSMRKKETCNHFT